MKRHYRQKIILVPVEVEMEYRDYGNGLQEFIGLIESIDTDDIRTALEAAHHVTFEDCLEAYEFLDKHTK